MTYLARVARRQHGVFTLEQAQRAGWERSTVRRWLQTGLWEEIAPRVYRQAGTATDWRSELFAATLSSGAIAARRSAAALYGWLAPPSVPELLVARGRRNLARATVHSTLDLPECDVTRVGLIPTTAPMRTLIDVAGERKLSMVEELVDRALLGGHVRPAALERRARDLVAPARPGAARVLRALATRHPEIELARNKWETRVLRIVRRLGLPDPTPNLHVVVGGHHRYLDVAWAPALVDLEYDGYVPHLESRRTFDDDRARQNDLVDAGWQVFRVTWSMLGRDAARRFAPIARAVSHRWPLPRNSCVTQAGQLTARSWPSQ
jgi:hypothetical protein